MLRINFKNPAETFKIYPKSKFPFNLNIAIDFLYNSTHKTMLEFYLDDDKSAHLNCQKLLI